MKKLLLILSCLFVASCTTTKQVYISDIDAERKISIKTTEPVPVTITSNQYCERQLMTINPLYQPRSYFWIENEDGTLDIKNKE